MRTFVDAVLGRVAYERLPEARKQQMRDNLAELAAEFRAHGGFSALGEREVRRLAIPTLLVSGERNPLFLRRISDFLAELIPGARTAVIPEASHVMHEENATATTAAILGFLGRPVGRQPATAMA